jgi:hypothetical protein
MSPRHVHATVKTGGRLVRAFRAPRSREILYRIDHLPDGRSGIGSSLAKDLGALAAHVAANPHAEELEIAWECAERCGSSKCAECKEFARASQWYQAFRQATYGAMPFVRRWATAMLDLGMGVPIALTLMILTFIGWWLVITDVRRGVIRP